MRTVLSFSPNCIQFNMTFVHDLEKQDSSLDRLNMFAPMGVHIQEVLLLYV